MEKKTDRLIREALKSRVFTACSVGYFIKKKNKIAGNIFNYGYAGEDQSNSPVDDETVFDLASLTKPLVTSLSVLALLEEEKLNIEEKVAKYFEKTSPESKNITLLHLLTHSSGLPAHRPYYQKLMAIPYAERMDTLIRWILAEKLSFMPGAENLYSDLGFILLGKIIEKISGESLDEYWERKIIAPLGLNKGLFFASRRKMDNMVCATTGTCGWSKKSLCGVVNDENCRSLGGVAGHAGLFGTAKAVLSLCENIVMQFQGERQHPSYSSENLRKAFRNKQGTWAFGFDTPTAGLSSSGKYFSDLTIGHLGFTGTSFWIDLQRGIAIVFLTNRVNSGESLTPIKRLRPLLHDTIMQILIKKPD